MSNVGKWDRRYSALTPNHTMQYGSDTTYLMAAAFLADVETVEDWGCGGGSFKSFCRVNYVGVDGSHTPFADKIVDLVDYRSAVSGIMMRHVLEHDYNWQNILANAIASFRKKFFLCLFTPFSEKTRDFAAPGITGIDVPVLSFSRADIEKYFDGLHWHLFENLVTDTMYKLESVYLIWR